MAISAGTRSQVFVRTEASFGNLGQGVSMGAANFVRTLPTGGITHNPFNFVASPERTQGNDRLESFRRRSTTTAAFSTLMRGAPGGDGAPDNDPMWRSLFGTTTPISISADPQNAAANDKIIGAVGTGNLLYPFIGQDGAAATNIMGTTITGGSPTFKSRNYNLSGELISLAVREQPAEPNQTTTATGPGTAGAPNRQASGWQIGEGRITLDGTTEGQVSFTGPARDAEIGIATNIDVGGLAVTALVPKGLSAKLYFLDLSKAVGSRVWAEMSSGFRSFNLTINNNIRARNDESGSPLSKGNYRGDQRDVMLEMTTYAEEGNELWDAINSTSTGPYTSIVCTWGVEEGGRCCLYLPNVRFNLPSADGDPAAMGWTFTGTGMAGPLGGDSSVALLMG